MRKQWTSYEKASFWIGILVLLVAILAWVTTRPTHQSGNATTTGPNSPATTGDNNKIQVDGGTTPPDSKAKDKEAPKGSAKDKP
ncbi:MAG: hypothetical protein WB994_11480 [Candidatus Acidiferrum sp.]